MTLAGQLQRCRSPVPNPAASRPLHCDSAMSDKARHDATSRDAMCLLAYALSALSVHSTSNRTRYSRTERDKTPYTARTCAPSVHKVSPPSAARIERLGGRERERVRERESEIERERGMSTEEGPRGALLCVCDQPEYCIVCHRVVFHRMEYLTSATSSEYSATLFSYLRICLLSERRCSGCCTGPGPGPGSAVNMSITRLLLNTEK